MTDISRLPTPVIERWEWQMDGACRDSDPGMFFHPEGERGPKRVQRENRAKEVCATCPVLNLCREWALATQETYGIWGGLGEGDRERIFTAASRNRRGLSTAA